MSWDKRLERLLEQHGEQKLPDLESEFGWITELGEMVRNYLRSLGFDLGDGIAAVELAQLYQIFGALVIAAVLFLLLRLVWLMIRSTKRSELDSAADLFPNSVDQPDELADAINAGLWGKALRLSWNLFLERAGRRPGVTPIQFFEGDNSDLVARLNRGMYLPEHCSAERFSKCIEGLERMEGHAQ